ncbi:CGNR zinc finger domain-containing protein [Streptomyces capparidis]
MPADDGWIRDGGRVCLDFVNTLRNRWDVPRETLRAPEELARWLRGAELLAPGPHPVGDGDLERARALREAVDRAVLAAAGGGLPGGADIALINDCAAAAPRPAPRLAVRGGRLAPERAPSTADGVAGALGLVAVDAVELLLSTEAARVRVCGSDTCGLRFVDRSPGRNRRWCSMARCGNRTKVRLHTRRRNAAADRRG